MLLQLRNRITVTAPQIVLTKTSDTMGSECECLPNEHTTKCVLLRTARKPVVHGLPEMHPYVATVSLETEGLLAGIVGTLRWGYDGRSWALSLP